MVPTFGNSGGGHYCMTVIRAINHWHGSRFVIDVVGLASINVDGSVMRSWTLTSCDSIISSIWQNAVVMSFIALRFRMIHAIVVVSTAAIVRGRRGVCLITAILSCIMISYARLLEEIDR